MFTVVSEWQCKLLIPRMVVKIVKVVYLNFFCTVEFPSTLKEGGEEVIHLRRSRHPRQSTGSLGSEFPSSIICLPTPFLRVHSDASLAISRYLVTSLSRSPLEINQPQNFRTKDNTECLFQNVTSKFCQYLFMLLIMFSYVERCMCVCCLFVHLIHCTFFLWFLKSQKLAICPLVHHFEDDLI